MSFLGLFKAKAAENTQKEQSPQPQSETPVPNPQSTPQNTAPPADMFGGGFVQFKKPAVTAGNKPPFSASTGGSTTQPFGTSPYGASGQVKIDYAGLSPINPSAGTFFSDGESFDADSQGECNTPNNVPVEQPAKKSAFSFIKKNTESTQLKTEGCEPTQLDPFTFMNNANRSNPELPNQTTPKSIVEEPKSFSAFPNVQFKKSQTLAASQNSESSTKTNPFPMTFKKPVVEQKPVDSEPDSSELVPKRRPSIDITSITTSVRKPSITIDNEGENENKSEQIESPPKVEVQNEQETTVKKGGPSFLRFKQKSQKSEEPGPTSNSELSAKADAFPPTQLTQKISSDHGGRSEKSFKEESPVQEAKQAFAQPIPPPKTDNQDDPDQLEVRLEEDRSGALEKIAGLVLQQNEIISNKESLEAEKNQLNEKVKELTRYQEEAIERESFEEADHLEGEITQIKEQIRHIEQEIEHHELNHAGLEREKGVIFQQSQMLYRTYINNIEKISLQRNHLFERYKLDCLNQQNTEKFHIQEETQRLQLNKNHLDIDLKHIEEESSGLEKNIEKQTKEYLQDQRDFSAQKTELEIEIDEIRRQLEAKEAQLAKVTTSLNQINSKIDGIRSKYSEPLQRISTKREKFDREESLYNKEFEKLNNLKENADNKIQIYTNIMANHQAALEAYDGLKYKFQEEFNRQSEESDERERVVEKYYDSLSHLKEAQTELSSHTSQIDYLKEDLQRLEKEVVDIGIQRSTLEKKIPELESEKKTYVASKSFKDASRISNEIKDIQAKIQQLEQRLEEVKRKEQDQADEITNLESTGISDLRRAHEDALRICNTHKLHFLAIREKDLSTILEYLWNRGHQREAELIETELQEVRAQLHELGLKNLQEDDRDIHEQQNLYDENHANYNEEENIHQDQPIGSENQIEDNREAEEKIPSDQNVAKEEEQMDLPDCVREYDEIAQKITELEGLIEQYAADEKYEEADDASNQQSQLRDRQQVLLQNVQKLGYNDIEEARGAANI